MEYYPFHGETAQQWYTVMAKCTCSLHNVATATKNTVNTIGVHTMELSCPFDLVYDKNAARKKIDDRSSALTTTPVTASVGTGCTAKSKAAITLLLWSRKSLQT